MPTSIEELQRLALAKGVSVTVDGKTFNNTRTKVSAGRQALHKPLSKSAKEARTKTAKEKEEAAAAALVPPEIAPAPQPTPSPPPEINVTVDLSELKDSNTKMLEAFTEAIKKQGIPQLPTPPAEWEFSVKRDDKGFIKTMTAKAV